MSKIRVGVLRGGASNEYDISMKTGAEVIKNLPSDIYSTVDIFVDKNGVWHVGGQEREPNEVVSMVDVIFNAMHGAYGEDGRVQQILEAHKVPYTGSRVRASAVGMNKILSKDAVKTQGVKSPYHQLIDREEYEGSSLNDLFRRIILPVIIKPVSGGSSLGVFFAETLEELWDGIGEALKHSDLIMLEQYIEGKEATVGVLDEFRGNSHYALLPVEIEKTNGEEVWGYDEKYSGETKEHYPGRFSVEEKRELERLAVLAHQAIGARHYSRSDFIVSPRGIYFLEINTLPGLTSESLVPKSLGAIGVTTPQFLDHIIKLALEEKYH